MKSTLMLLVSATTALAAGFIPNVRVDHQNLPNHRCVDPAIAVGPGTLSDQTLYAVFQDDSTAGVVARRSDVVFQKSKDAGATWLTDDKIVRRGERFAMYPDVTTDSDGNIYIVYTEEDASYDGHFFCVHSTDGGETWSSPVKIDDNAAAVGVGWARIAADSAGNLFCAWNDDRTGRIHIWSSVSTDRGTTWSPNVRVCSDSAHHIDCHHADVFVQPGTNRYLVAASGYYSYFHANLYRSTDMGQTFQPRVQLDTFEGYTGQPHVVADRDHIICDYTGADESIGGFRTFTEARTFYTGPDTWGGPVSVVTNLDTLYSSYYNGARLALSPDGRVHTALMYNRTFSEYDLAPLDGICYVFSTDHGTSWSDLTRINDSLCITQNPDIGADSAGNAYVVWQDGRNHRGEIWFSTNNDAGIAESPTHEAPRTRLTVEPSVFSRTTNIRLSASSFTARRSAVSIYDASGLLVRSLALPASPSRGPCSLTWNGGDDTGHGCAPGAYLVRACGATAKVVLLSSE